MAPLADLFTVLNGRAYKQSELLSAGTPVLRVGNLFTSDRWYYSNLQLEEDKYCDKGDLIFAWSASFGPFIWSGDKVIYHYHIWKLPLHNEADLYKRYLYNFLLQKTREIKEAGHGIAMIHMTKEKMELLQVPLPPIAEQHRIVAKVDELMAWCDRLEATRASREPTRDQLAAASLARLNAPAPETFQNDVRFALDALPALTTRSDQIKQLRQTILNLAVRGKLVPQDPNDEPASVPVKRIAKAKAERKKKTGDARIKIEPDPMPGDLDMPLPRGWAAQSFENLFLFIDYRGNTPPKTDDGIPLITRRTFAWAT
jgi:type I restriction enzyme, S subunit